MENLNFDFYENVSLEVIEKYYNKIPEQIIEIWKDKGLGSFLNGYLKVVNPDDYLDILKESYVNFEKAIPVFLTGMGDILVWQDNYLLLLNYRKGKVDVVGGKFKFFFKNLEDDYFLEKVLDWTPYPEAIKKYGTPGFNECFGYVPLLGIGGTEKIENLDKVKIVEHIYLISQMLGPLL